MVNGTIVFQSFSEWDRFQAGSEARLTIALTQTAISSNLVLIDVPQMRYSTLPINIGGPGPIAVQFTGRGMIDPTSGYSLEITVVNTRVSGYFTNAAA
jgi:hypothetical protein